MTAPLAGASRLLVRVRQGYRYAYESPIRGLTQRLVMIPPPRFGDQHVVDSSIRVQGGTGVAVRSSRDAFGNTVHHVSCDLVRRAVSFDVDYTVTRRNGVTTTPRVVRPTRVLLEQLLEPTPLTFATGRLRYVARWIRERHAATRDRADAAHLWTADALRYEIGVTSVATPAEHALNIGKGVCQDYAHVLLSLLRLLQIPGRYVSGHLLGSGVPHAWVEALVEDGRKPGSYRVVPYDPTHRRLTDHTYVTVAVGRDFTDVSPTSGAYFGAAEGRLDWSKQAEIVGVLPARSVA